jgi:hypothetical protein
MFSSWNIVITFLISYCSAKNFQPVTWTENGEVVGTVLSSLNGRSIYAFMSIPYAAPPVGVFRFQV